MHRWIFLGIWMLCLLLPRVVSAEKDALLDVRLFAHRGFAVHHPENSMASIGEAMKLGLYGTEIDLRSTRDGRFVLLHDATVNRTTTGTGNICEMTFEEVRSFFLKDRKGRVTDLKVPDFGEVLELVKSRPGFRLALDLKNVDVEKVAEVVKESGLWERVYFFIADPMDVETVRRIKKCDPRLKVSVDLLTWWKIEGLPTFTIRALGADALFASEWFFPRFGFSEAREAGAEVMVYLWGQNDLPDRLRKAAALGAEVVSCDRPDQLLPYVIKH